MSIILSVVLMAALCASPIVIVAQAPAPTSKPPVKASTPRTPWGDPDLQGTYTTDNSIGVPFERPKQFGERAVLTEEEFAAREKGNQEQIAKDLGEFPETQFGKDPASNNAPRHWLERGVKLSRHTSLVVEPPDGRIPPMTPEAQKRLAARAAYRKSRAPSESYEDHSHYDRCITRGVVGSILPVIYGNGTAITQAPGLVIIRNEMIHEARIISLDGRPHVGKGIRMFMGDPRGRWEGDTLVVESTNFTDRTGLGGNGGGAIHSESLRLVERFTRVNATTIQYEFTVDDPATFTKPWTARVELTSKPGYEIYEYACHEGNLGLANMMSGARADERAAASKK